MEDIGKFKSRQSDIYENKINHGFNVTDQYIEMECLLGEVLELFRAVRNKDTDNTMEELADIVIFCYGLAEINKGDLDKAIFDKMEINKGRKYIKNKNGDFVKIED